MRLSVLFLTFLLGGLGIVQAGEPLCWRKQEILARRLEMRQQSRGKMPQKPQMNFDGEAAGEKTVKKAVLFSALVPGSGQFYAKSYIKSAVFLAAEIGAWAVNISYTKKGDQKDSEFKDYANSHWSEYRYWSYVNYYAIEQLGYSQQELYQYQQEPAPNGGDWYLIDEQYFNAHRSEIVSRLREVEQSGFSHQLPSSKTQQYYEMIGKYPHQFGASWDDANFNTTYSGPDNITSRNDYYTEMREDSNRLYNVAQYALMAVLVNHVISAVDAGFTTRSYNRRHLRMEMSYDNLRYKGEYVNMMGVNLRW